MSKIVVGEVENCFVKWFGEKQHKQAEKSSTETTAVSSQHCAVNIHAHVWCNNCSYQNLLCLMVYVVIFVLFICWEFHITDTCVHCKSIYIFCISQWPRGCNFIISFLSCFSWGNKRNCNTEIVQSSAALNTVLVKQIIWYLSFSFPIMKHPHFCHLYFEVLYLRFSQWWRSIIWSMLK